MANQLKNTLGIDAGPTYLDFDPAPGCQRPHITTPFRTGWQADYPTMFNFLGTLYGTGAGSNDGDYSNTEFDQLIPRAASAGTGDALRSTGRPRRSC